MQIAEFSLEYVPAGHWVHVAAPAPENVPGLHLLQLADTAKE